VNSKDIIKRLNAEGWSKTGGKGSNQKFCKDGKIVIVPHPKQDLPVGTVKSIFKQAGWE
jgi:predicted RNA binding protein YcfA (HicA-like mRNA interferase family)